jgi:hypothetical protein
MDRQEIAALAEEASFPRISLYFPTHEKGREIQQDPIRLKNAIAKAAAELERVGWRGSDIDRVLAETRARTEYSDFWLHQGRALAVFIDGEGATRFVQLPEETGEVVVVAERYHLRPLIRMFGARQRGYLLAVTRGTASLHQVTRYDMAHVSVEGMPESLDEVRDEVDFEDAMDFHPNARGSVARSQGGAEGRPQYHGLGPSPEDYDEVLLVEYLGRVARAADDHLERRAAGAPLALAAEPRTFGHLRPLVKCRWALEEGLQLNPAGIDDKELHRRAWELLARELDEDRDAALERLQAQLGSNGGMQRDIATLAKAAVEGRLHSVFLEPGAHRWGHYDSDRHDVAFAEGPGAGEEDLIDFIAVRTLQQGGAVYAFEAPEADRLGPVAGVLRF